MQRLQLLPRDVQVMVSLLCIKSRDGQDRAPGHAVPQHHPPMGDGTRGPILPSLSSPGANYSVFPTQCWAISVGGAGRQVSALLLCWVCFHTPIKPILWSSSACLPSTLLSCCARKSRLAGGREPCLPHHQYHPSVSNWFHHQPTVPLVALPLFGTSCPAARCRSQSSTTACLTSVSLSSLPGCSQPPHPEKRLQSCKRLFRPGYPNCLSRSMPCRVREQAALQRQQGGLEHGARGQRLRDGRRTVICGWWQRWQWCSGGSGAADAGWQVSRGSCRPGCSKSCWMWE